MTIDVDLKKAQNLLRLDPTAGSVRSKYSPILSRFVRVSGCQATVCMNWKYISVVSESLTRVYRGPYVEKASLKDHSKKRRDLGLWAGYILVKSLTKEVAILSACWILPHMHLPVDSATQERGH